MGMKDLFLDLTLGSWAGDAYRANKAAKDVANFIVEERARKEAEEERRHQELLQAIRDSGRK